MYFGEAIVGRKCENKKKKSKGRGIGKTEEISGECDTEFEGGR